MRGAHTQGPQIERQLRVRELIHAFKRNRTTTRVGRIIREFIVRSNARNKATERVGIQYIFGDSNIMAHRVRFDTLIDLKSVVRPLFLL